MMVRTDQRGLTVVELIITIVIGLVLASSVSTLVINQSNLAQRGRDTVLANSFVETKIEELRSEGYNLLVSDTTPIEITSEMPSELNEPRNGSYVVSDGPLDGLKQIDITIQFNNQGTQQTLEYRSYIGELGVGQY